MFRCGVVWCGEGCQLICLCLRSVPAVAKRPKLTTATAHSTSQSITKPLATQVPTVQLQLQLQLPRKYLSNQPHHTAPHHRYIFRPCFTAIAQSLLNRSNTFQMLLMLPHSWPRRVTK